MVGYEIRNTHTLPRAHDYDKDLLYKLKDDTEDILEQVTDLSLNVPILDQSGLIPASYLPSYVDDVLEYPSYNSLPTLGETGKIYVTTDTDLTYRWSGSTYIEISKSIITGVKGDAESNYRVGNVNITAAHIGLANVANIDLSKAIKTITRSGTTFTYTCLDGTTGTFTQQDENTWRPLGTGANDACAGNDSRLSNYRPASDVYAWAKAATKPSYTASEVGAVAKTGDTMSNALIVGPNTTYGNFNEGIRLINAANNWTGITFGATGSSGCSPASGLVAWFAAKTNTSKFIISPNGSADTTGLTLNNSGDMLWRNSKVYTAGNCTIPTKTSQLTNDSGFITSGSYLPLSGGTLSGSNNVLNIKSNTSDSWIYFYINSTAKASAGYYGGLAFVANENSTGRIGVNDSGTPQYWTNYTGSAKYTLLHSGNYSSYALPLSGGTISGDLAITGKCTNTASAGSAFRWGGSGGPHYIGNNGTEAYFYSGNSLGLGLATGGSWRLYITKNGTVSIGSTNPAGDGSNKIYVSGSGYFESSVSASTCQSRSDLRLKDVLDWNKNIDINVIASAPILTFKWKDSSIDNKVHIGTSAQYWNEYLPEAVSEELNGYLSMDYGSTALASSIRVAKEVVELKEKIKLLEEENKQLKEELELLKSQINDILTTINKSTNNE